MKTKLKSHLKICILLSIISLGGFAFFSGRLKVNETPNPAQENDSSKPPFIVGITAFPFDLDPHYYHAQYV